LEHIVNAFSVRDAHHVVEASGFVTVCNLSNLLKVNICGNQDSCSLSCFALSSFSSCLSLLFSSLSFLQGHLHCSSDTVFVYIPVVDRFLYPIQGVLGWDTIVEDSHVAQVPSCITSLFQNITKNLRIVNLELIATVQDLRRFFVDELVDSKSPARSFRLQQEGNDVVLALAFGW
jgi:hypothetical protein